MRKQLLLSVMIAAGLVLAPAAFAEGNMGMDKPAMSQPMTDKSDKMAKPDAMAKPASDKMEKPGAMMDKKGSMADPMKK